MPEDLYRPFSKAYVVNKYEQNQVTDQYYFIGHG